jgi:poly(A) polymerase
VQDRDRMFEALDAPPLAERLAAVRAAAGGPAWLVGGSVRDLLAGGRPPLDIDVALSTDAFDAGRALASALGGSFVALDEERRTARVVADGGVTFDLTTTAGGPIEADLARRDFTVNAMAVALDGIHVLLDPFGGRADLAARVVRAVSEAALAEDPARVLRAFRFAATLEFAIDADTLEMARRHAPGLAGVAGERLCRDLALLLAAPRAARAVTLADEAGVLGAVLPELEAERGVTQNAYHHLDVLGHSLEALRRLELLLDYLPALAGDDAPRLSAFLAEEPVAERPRTALLKLAVLLHDAGKPPCRDVRDGRVIFYGHPNAGADLARVAAARLRLSSRETEELARYVARHMTPVDLLAHPMTPRREARFFRREGECGLALLLLSLADAEATRGPAADPSGVDRLRAFATTMIADYYAWAEPRLAEPLLVDGVTLMRTFQLAPGREVGALLALVRDAQDAGELASRDDALRLVREALAEGGTRG